jgi:hypothetical protein
MAIKEREKFRTGMQGKYRCAPPLLCLSSGGLTAKSRPCERAAKPRDDKHMGNSFLLMLAHAGNAQ